MSNKLRITQLIIIASLPPLPPAGRRASLTRVSKMPIWAPLESEHEVFSPVTLAVLAIALEDTLRHLRLVDRNDPAVTRVAKRIIELARKGEYDPVRLRDGAIQSLR